jgi:hypothetical protein
LAWEPRQSKEFYTEAFWQMQRRLAATPRIQN